MLTTLYFKNALLAIGFHMLASNTDQKAHWDVMLAYLHWS